MYQIDLDNQNNGNPRVTTYIPFAGYYNGRITVRIEGGRDQFDTIKLIVEPSRAVNPPFIQYFNGIRRFHVAFGECSDLDIRRECIIPFIESAMDIRYTSYAFTKWHITRAINMLTPMLSRLDREYNKLKRKEKAA